MLASSNLDVIDTLRHFKSANIPVSFLVPTQTGMEKSIMDATKEVRDFLATTGTHDYQSQAQGTENKVTIPSIIIAKGQLIETQTSLYRPNTKNGDPRIWVYKLNDFAEPTDLLALVSSKDGLLIINCSKTDLYELLDSENDTFKKLLSRVQIGMSEVASELIEKLKKVSALGFVRTKRPGDTGVGYTLESYLGIEANSSKAPDYKGIEIKSKRIRSNKTGRTTIFSQVPNWSISRLKGSKELLYERGKYNEEKKRVQLFHELSATKLNSYGLQLELDTPNNFLHQIFIDETIKQRDVTWELNILKNRLVEKHKETFWVTAKTNGKSGDVNEEFLYSSVKHTGQVDQTVFPVLLETGVVTLDYTIKEKSPGVAKDQGYLFKIAPKNLDLLFSQAQEYQLQ